MSSSETILTLQTIFDHFYCRLAVYRNTAFLHSATEFHLSTLPDTVKGSRRDHFDHEIQSWAQDLLEKAYAWCGEPGGQCPILDPYADTSTSRLPPLPSSNLLQPILNGILVLHISSSEQYSPRTRTFFQSFGPFDEEVIVSTLRNPDQAVHVLQEQAETTRESHNKRNKTWRIAGMGLAAVTGGVLVGVTGGLAAPLLGGAVSSIFGIFGLGGTAAGLLATGLASSGAVCGALFGVYGAHSTASMVQRHTKDISDLSIVPVKKISQEETLAVRLCVSGWLADPSDVWAPWTIFKGDDTFALQWEVKALSALSDALFRLMTSQAFNYIRGEILQRTLFASIMTALAPIALLNVGKIIDNPWMNSRALALKTGRVLGDLLAQRAFGNRPVSLCGFSLGALVIFEALTYLSTLPPSQTVHLIHDVYLFGTPVSTQTSKWASVRRVVSGRLVNGYSTKDLVLAVLSRASSTRWEQAGLTPVQVNGVENILCDRVDGHTKWRGVIGECLRTDVKVRPGTIDDTEVDKQLSEVARKLDEECFVPLMPEEEIKRVNQTNEL